MIGGSDAPVLEVKTSSAHDLLSVPVSGGQRRGVVSWDRLRCTYRADIDLFAAMPEAQGFAVQTADAVWSWVSESRSGVLPGRLVIGHRLVELVTIDSVVNRLTSLGFHPDGRSLQSLIDLRSAVRDRCGSVVFQGRLRSGGRELVLGLPGGRNLPVSPRFDHPEHGFGWGRRAEATFRTARVLVDMAWSPQRDPATEAAVTDLAVSVLAEVTSGFVWRAESVADWIATESAELVTGPDAAAPEFVSGDRPSFDQLSLELR